MSTQRSKPSDDTAPAARAWDLLGKRLASVLRKLKEDHALIVQEKSTNRFVQFLGQGAGGMRAEVVSNAYLPARLRFSAEQINSLLELGWLPPTGSPDEATPHKQPDGSPNFMQQFDKPVDAGKVAELAVATLARVMCIPHPGFLCYEGRNVDTGRSLTWNELELKRAEPRATVADAAERLLQTLRAETGNPSLDFDDDGDIALRHGSAAVFVSLSADASSVRIHAPVLLDVRKTPELLERLNELNRRVIRPAFFHASDCVIAAADIPASLDEDRHVMPAVQAFCALADGIDELLQAEFGGRTAFPGGMTSTKIH